MVTFKSLKPVKKIQRRYNNESSGPEVIVGANILIFNSYSTALASILIGQRDNICDYWILFILSQISKLQDS